MGIVVLNYWVAKIQKKSEIQTLFTFFHNIFDQFFNRLKHAFSRSYKLCSKFYSIVFDQCRSGGFKVWHDTLSGPWKRAGILQRNEVFAKFAFPKGQTISSKNIEKEIPGHIGSSDCTSHITDRGRGLSCPEMGKEKKKREKGNHLRSRS